MCAYSRPRRYYIVQKNIRIRFFNESGVEYGKPENAQNEFTQQCMQRPKNCVCMVSEY